LPKSDGWPSRGTAQGALPAAMSAGQEKKMKKISFKDQEEELIAVLLLMEVLATWCVLGRWPNTSPAQRE